MSGQLLCSATALIFRGGIDDCDDWATLTGARFGSFIASGGLHTQPMATGHGTVDGLINYKDMAEVELPKP